MVEGICHVLLSVSFLEQGVSPSQRLQVPSVSEDCGGKMRPEVPQHAILIRPRDFMARTHEYTRCLLDSGFLEHSQNSHAPVREVGFGADGSQR
jgi:hypothetical protein